MKRGVRLKNLMESFKGKFLKGLPIELNQLRNAMKISFITKLLNRVHDECALCEEIKLLEYLAIDDQDNLYDICENCKKKVEEIMHFDYIFRIDAHSH